MIIDLALLVGGLVLLVVSADQFVLGASRVAQLFSLSPLVVGAVVIGFGTSAPELVVSVTAAAGGDLALGAGNVVGSNVANLSLVLAAAAMTTRLAIAPGILRREAPVSVVATCLFAVVVIDGNITRLEGVGLAVAMVIALVVLLAGGLRAQQEAQPLSTGHRRSHEALRLVAGLTGVVLAARLVVDGATGLAAGWGLTGGFVGFSLVAVGTSLPELVTTLAAARRRETGLIVGNLLGSNVFNSLTVGAGMGLVGPGLIDDDALVGTGITVMVVVAIAAYAMAARGLFLGRLDGVILFGIYLVAMVLLIGNSTDENAVLNDSAPQGLIDQFDGMGDLHARPG